MEDDIQVTICGGGNLCHASIATISHHNPKMKLNLFTRKPDLWTKTITGLTDLSAWKYKGSLTGHLSAISNNPADVIPGSKIVIVAGPAHIHADILKKIAPYVDNNAFVGSVYGQGAFDLQAKAIFGDIIAKRNITIWALFNVPFICKILQKGKLVRIIGPKKHLYCASYPIEKVHETATWVSLLWYIPTFTISNFLCLTLTPSNQIIHPGRVMAVFRDWDGKSAYKKTDIPRLYDLDKESADEIQKLDNEIQAIKKAILKKYPEIDLNSLLPIKERIIKQYEEQISDKSTLQSVFSTNMGYDILTFPMVSANDGVVIDTKHRFFWEDIPYGLCILKNYGDAFKVPMPNCEKVIQFHQKFMGGIKFLDKENNLVMDNIQKTGAPSKYGYTSTLDFVATSLPQKPNIVAKL